ncbi:ATP-binding cassette domain-containing protein [Thomasclavelia cocleata]|uniref:ATP-binding cassette domain-containing protein n=3 Tax=Thomasclavelia cocleata TaxID=69824 RepID=UPI00351635B0
MKIEIQHLSKSYGNLLALNNINLTLTPGIYALLGSNGAGKSTLINLLTGNLKPSNGCILYNGKNISELNEDYRAILGYMPQQQGLYEQFNAYRFLNYMAALKGMDKKTTKAEIERVLKIVNLQKDAHRLLGQYSGGMKQRILVAQAIMNQPDIIILDEPTAGLDPKERIRIRNIISEIAGDKIVLFATHVVSDIEHIAKEVILIKNGSILNHQSPLEFCKSIQGKVFEIFIEEKELKKVQDIYLISNITQQANGLLVRILTDQPPISYHYQESIPNLEDVYLYHFSDEKKGG